MGHCRAHAAASRPPCLSCSHVEQAIWRHAARAQRVVAEAVKGVRAAGKTAIATMAMNCHVTLTP